MDIILPKRIDGQEPGLLPDTQQITIIGANGSGKSRFCTQLMKAAGDKAYRISALRALLPEHDGKGNDLPGSINALFKQMNAYNPHITNDADTEFEKLTYIMLMDEFRELMNYKTGLMIGEKDRKFPKTKLDIVVKRWQEVFPRNKVLRENGKLLFSTEGNTDKYSSLRLSDGEKTVLYYLGAVLYAMPDAVILVDDPEMFIHHNLVRTLWNVIEEMRPDCTFIYNTHDVDFASSRVDNQCVWVKSFDAEQIAWDYEVMTSSQHLDDGLYYELLGSRKPVLFIEGDDTHSLDSRLYPLIFPEYTVKPLGSCNKVIEVVRSFNDLNSFHHLISRGIVDRDRRSDHEVEYLRQKNIFVPDVAEVENIFMIEAVIRGVAQYNHRKDGEIVTKVKNNVFKYFNSQLKQQALQHVRHRVKHDVEIRIDMKFRNINALEEHMLDLVNELNPRGFYEQTCREFRKLVQEGDYMGILRVFNQKQMIGESNVAILCGCQSKESYFKTVLHILKTDTPISRAMRTGIKELFGFTDATNPDTETAPKQTIQPKNQEQ